MTLTWNLVCKHIHPHEPLRNKIREKISKLEEHLQHFPPDAVHLLIGLEQHPKTGLITAALTLRLPSNILRCTKEAQTQAITAFDLAIKTLIRELKGLKSELRRKSEWHKGFPVEVLPSAVPSRFAREPAPQSASTLGDTLAELIRRYHGRLLYHVRRQLQRDQQDGIVPRDAISGEVVVDEVVRQALSRPQAKPDDISYRLWLYSLIRRELKRRYRSLKIDGVRNVSIDEPTVIPDDGDTAETYETTPPFPDSKKKPARASATRGDQLRDASNPNPAEVAAEHDLVDFLHKATASWPALERAVFDLHFLEGFDANEVAVMEKIEPGEAEKLIHSVQVRLRGLLMGATGRWAVTA